MAPSVIIVNANDGIREVLVRVVRRLGMDAVTFDSAEGFLRGADVAAIDCLVVDDDLGTMSGLSMLERCGRWPPGARVVLLLGAHDADTAARAARLGLTTVDKPFDVRILANAIRDR